MTKTATVGRQDAFPELEDTDLGTAPRRTPRAKADVDDGFTRDRLAWLEQVQDDPAITPSGFALAFAIARSLNRQTRVAFPGQALLAQRVGVSDRQVRTLVSILVVSGHLRVESGGFQKADRYSIVLSDRKPTSGINVEADFRPGPEPDFRSEGRPDRKPTSKQTGSPLPPNPLNQPIKDKNPLSGVAHAVVPRPTKGSKFCPSDWTPTAEDLAFAAERGFSQNDLDREMEKFRDHEFDKPKTDWSRTLRRWLRTAVEMAEQRNHRQTTLSPQARASGAAWAMEGLYDE